MGSRKQIKKKTNIIKNRKEIQNKKGHKKPHATHVLIRTKKKKQGVAAIEEIKKFQSTTHLLIRKAPFQRVVREIAEMHKPGIRFKKDALQNIQDAAEQYITNIFKLSDTFRMLQPEKKRPKTLTKPYFKMSVIASTINK